MEVVVYGNYIGRRWFYQYVVNIGRWSPYEGGQLERFHCISIWNKEELPEEWKESIIVPIQKKEDKTDCNNYRGFCQLHTKFCPTFCSQG